MSQQLANHHDAFFKKVMSEPHLAGTFLREHLPPDLVELLTLESPQLLPGSFVDEALAQHHSDLQRQDLPQHLEVILVPQLSNMDLLTVFQYIDRGPVPVSREVLQRALRSLDQRRYEELMGHFSQEFFAEGEAKGRAEGKAEGEVAGEAKALIRLLEKRFGVVPSHLRERISSADAASIEAWLDRTLEASDMPSIFQPAI